jgi:hypothetical protein
VRAAARGARRCTTGFEAGQTQRERSERPSGRGSNPVPRIDVRLAAAPTCRKSAWSGLPPHHSGSCSVSRRGTLSARSRSGTQRLQSAETRRKPSARSRSLSGISRALTPFAPCDRARSATPLRRERASPFQSTRSAPHSTATHRNLTPPQPPRRRSLSLAPPLVPRTSRVAGAWRPHAPRRAPAAPPWSDPRM